MTLKKPGSEWRSEHATSIYEQEQAGAVKNWSVKPHSVLFEFKHTKFFYFSRRLFAKNHSISSGNWIFSSRSRPRKSKFSQNLNKVALKQVVRKQVSFQDRKKENTVTKISKYRNMILSSCLKLPKVNVRHLDLFH